MTASITIYRSRRKSFCDRIDSSSLQSDPNQARMNEMRVSWHAAALCAFAVFVPVCTLAGENPLKKAASAVKNGVVVIVDGTETVADETAEATVDVAEATADGAETAGEKVVEGTVAAGKAGRDGMEAATQGVGKTAEVVGDGATAVAAGTKDGVSAIGAGALKAFRGIKRVGRKLGGR